MSEHDLKQTIAAADAAINAEDFDSLLDFYTDDAVLALQPGHTVHGKADIRQAFDRIAAYFNHSLRVRQGKMHILTAGDTALVLAETFVESGTPTDEAHVEQRAATYIFKRCADGCWRCAVDNSYGTALLDAP